jgi:hypothetical protein
MEVHWGTTASFREEAGGRLGRGERLAKIVHRHCAVRVTKREAASLVRLSRIRGLTPQTKVSSE